MNRNRHKMNQEPTGQSKEQSRFLGDEQKLNKRSEVLQARRGKPNLNVGTTEDENAVSNTLKKNPGHPKSGR
jgi:hypothetical protein